MTTSNGVPDVQVREGKNLRARRWAKGVAAVAIAGAIVAGSAMVGTAAGRHGRRGGFGFGAGDGLPPLRMLSAALDLTQAQQDQAKAILAGHRADFQQLRERGRTARVAVRSAVQADPVNEQAIRAAVSQASLVQADAAVLRANVRQEVLALLSADQRARLDQMKQSFRDRQHHRRGDRSQPRPQSTQPQPQQ